MSGESEILDLPCCRIVDGFIGEDGIKTLFVNVSYGNIIDCEYNRNDYIEVEADSDFAKLIRYLLKEKTEDELKKAIQAN